MLFSDGKTSVCCVMRLRQCMLGDEDKTGASCCDEVDRCVLC